MATPWTALAGKDAFKEQVILQKARLPSLINTIWNELMQPSSCKREPASKQAQSFPPCKGVIGSSSF